MSDDAVVFEPTPERKSVKKSEALWLMSFSDMSLVLLCFFVLMLASMKPDKEKFKHIKEGMTAETPVKKTDSVKSVAKKIEKVISEKKLEKSASVTHDTNGLHIEFKDKLLFRSGSATLNTSVINTMKELMRVVATLNQDYHITIEGHTDDSPLKGSLRYPSNWELSASRGVSIMRQLALTGIKESRMSVEAFAHTRPRVPYTGLKGRDLQRARAANRRVVIRID